MTYRNQKPPVTLLGVIEAQTKKAVLFRAHEWDEGEWMPKSAVSYGVNTTTVEVEIKIAAWLADKNGWQEHGDIDVAEDDE